MRTTTSIGIADDHPLVLRGIADLIDSLDEYELVGQAVDAASAMALVERAAPDIMLMDFSMPGDVLGTISRTVAEYSLTRIIILTAFSSLDSAMKALEAGAMGFALKGSPVSEILEAIEAVRTDQLYVARQYAADVLIGMRRKDRQREISNALRLNVREKQIVGQLMHARTNREIAESLNLSEKTVKHYMTGLMAKFNARNRVEVVLAARQTLVS